MSLYHVLDSVCTGCTRLNAAGKHAFYFAEKLYTFVQGFHFVDTKNSASVHMSTTDIFGVKE